MIPEDSISYSYIQKVDESHLDNLMHVNNVVYLQWVNDISEKHWNILAGEELKTRYFWVVLRHELDYFKEAKLDDELTISTWVGQSKGVKSVRHVEIHKKDTLLLKAASTWCLIDSTTQRPTRIKNDILRILEPRK
ncbi:acyl-CoA thioesterase [Lutimonas saemankumensis]|uniref:acyl-CoA thioesterase n=1 Tax=Lutimonas saemankumensis TaxID=483016 RepID=UPI001CD23611|nr:thioesterase family protein [Lutimonas saemankumensis]MCA0931642.1 acyl-CoA thioesterase [Lutimonas saemankumensis]